MMKKYFIVLMAIVAFCCVLSLTSVDNTLAAGPIEISFQTTYPETHATVVNGIKPWIKTVDERTDGRIKIIFYPQNALVPTKDAYANVVSGMLDMGQEGTFFRPDLFQGLTIDTIPFVASSSEANARLLKDLIKKFPELIAKLNETKLCFTWSSAPAQLHTTKPVKNLEDIKGMRIISSDPQALMVLKALGANPIEMMFTEIYMALQRNTADGCIFPLTPAKAFKITEVAKYHTILNLNVGPFVGVMNKDKWNQIPPDLQKVLEETFATLGSKLSKSLDDGDKNLIKELTAEGNEIYVLPKDEKKKWKEKITPVINELIKKAEDRGYPNARAIYEEAVRLGEKYEK